MRRPIKYLAVSSEFYFMVIILISFIYNYSLVHQTKTTYVNQYNSFEDFAGSIIKCKSNTSTTLIDNYSITLSSRGSYNQGIEATEEHNIPECPIDKERFRYHDEYNLDIRLNYDHIRFGGKFKPFGCKPLQKVAIVIPYRDRAEHLGKFSLYIHQFLPDQLVEYSLYVIEQADSKPFNRAKLFNVGVLEITKLESDVCCFIFHDVDLLPLNQENLYMCSTRPRHLSINLSTMRYHLLYQQLFGGAISMTREQYDAIGGFSNDFYGWGGEDDDIFNRVRVAGYKIDRGPAQFGNYHMMKHSKSKPNVTRFRLLQDDEKSKKFYGHSDYKVEFIKERQLYTVISVKI